MTLEELKSLCRISGFELLSDTEDKLLKDFGEIAEVMDRIKDWKDTTAYVSDVKGLADLREDKEKQSDLVIKNGISAPRVVQEDD